MEFQLPYAMPIGIDSPTIAFKPLEDACFLVEHRRKSAFQSAFLYEPAIEGF